MINSLGALITRNGNMLRANIARAATVARHLLQLRDGAEYQVVYWQDGMPQRVTAEEFLTRYRSGMIHEASRLFEPPHG
jgi:hypothetical protein